MTKFIWKISSTYPPSPLPTASRPWDGKEAFSWDIRSRLQRSASRAFWKVSLRCDRFFSPPLMRRRVKIPGYAQGVYPDPPAPGRHKPFSPRRCRPLEAEGRRDGGRPAALLRGRGVSVAPGDGRRGFPPPTPAHPPRASPFPEPAGFQTFRVRRRRDWRGGGHLHANEAPPPAARRSIGTRGKEHAFRLGRRGESRPQHAPSAPRNSPHRRLPAGCRGTPLPRTPSPSKARASLLCFLMNPG